MQKKQRAAIPPSDKGEKPMKYMIASDIHGSAYYCRKMMEALEKEKADRLILLGDLLYHGPRNDLPKEYAPKEVIQMLNKEKNRIYNVRGNCDAEVDQMVLEFPVLADYGFMEIDGKTFYMSHGHIYNENNLPPNNGGTVNVSKQEEEKLSWLRQILEWQKDMSDGKEFMSLLKSDLDLFAESVYCFTPAGDVKNLPNGSTPIDFAYSIHSAVGNKMIGARANGKLVNIDYVIQNGDRIEIITSQNSKGPSRDWLKIVKSAQAKNKINQWFRNELKEDNITRGKELMAAYCKSRSITLSDLMKPSYMESVMRKYGFRDWDSALAAIGHGGLKEGQVVNKLLDEYNKQHQKEITDEHIMEAAEGKEKMRIAKSGNGIVVKGIHDVAVRFSKCCSPVPGDEIVGFVTRGRGISVHRTDCVNVMNLSETDRARLIEAEWQKSEQDKNERYTVEIKIFGYNRTGLLVDISKIFTERKIDLSSLNCRVNKQGVATILLTFDVQGKEELASLTAKIRQIESVIDIQRTSG